MMEKKFSFVDLYLDHSVFFDCFIVAILLIANIFLPSVFTLKYDLPTQFNILSSLIGTSVSLAGFILAALTIIVAFKSNIASKPLVEAKNPLELLFSTDNYTKIISVFKDAILELTAACVVLYTIWILAEIFPPYVLLYGNIYAGLFIFFSIARTLFVLFLVLTLDKVDNEEG